MKTAIGVFGTWRAQENSEIYQAAMKVGEMAAQRGFDVLTGAYSGIMEAAPRGAREVGGKAVGYALDMLASELAINPYLTSHRTFESLALRCARLIEDSDICVFFPGRTGTIAELALATEMRSKGVMQFPLILYGNYWESFFTWRDAVNNKLQLPTDNSDTKDLFRVVSDTRSIERLFEEWLA